ncbi:MAG TPA: anthranilate synthase component I [Candidatus Omnitrophota bacterium]|nr:anthranilate synthase component I [Candidatus Omnitrophota bacterium]HPT07505.1 anthranilate synthase component I [Candidatus Omnitrophota bacterium]
MYYPSFSDFLKLSKQGNVIPVYKEINADLDTPVSSFLKLHKSRYAFLLESVEGQEKLGRYSFLGSDPSLIFSSKGRNIEIRHGHVGKVERFVTKTDPLAEVKKIMQGFKAVSVSGLPRFYGGLVGYIGYDSVRFFERIPDKNPDELGLPDMFFMFTDTILLFDHVNHTIKVVANVILSGLHVSRAAKKRAYDQAVRKIDTIIADCRRTIPRPLVRKANKPVFESNFKKDAFCAIVRKAQEYIKAGDIIQVVPSQRFRARTHKEPFEVYRALRSLNPSPYMFFIRMGDVCLVGSSPEILVRCENGIVQVRPIAGTRPRGLTEEADKKLEEELKNDIKERAEHIMLVDLGRNDVGRVAKPGTVAVSDLMVVERYSHVMHLVSEVRGVVDRKFDVYDVLRASFPAGTVSGSPKIRAMEIIDELENTKRGPYAGCVGYFSFSHNMDMCITIRTIVMKQGIAYIQAGGGIVADSVPEKEYMETVNKAKALFEAVAQQ